jgi:hypothetical protein
MRGDFWHRTCINCIDKEMRQAVESGKQAFSWTT